jgi:flagella basal body P-ring formation protein FlgA
VAAAVLVPAGGAFGAAVTAGARLRAEAVVAAPTIRLGEVAHISGTGPMAKRLAGVEIGPAPLPGRERTISADSVRIRLRQNRLDPALLSKGPERTCRVTRAAQSVPADRILDAARDFLKARLADGPGRLALECLTEPRGMTLPTGALELAASLPPGGTGATRRVTITATVDGKPGARADLLFRVRRYTRIAVASASIPRGETLQGRVAYEERDLTGLPADIFEEGRLPEGLLALRALSPGTPITGETAAPPPLIHRGDAILLRAVTGDIVVSAPAEALEDGREGEVIRVRNANSRRESRARVVDAGTAEALL